jgi:hypothetical protein
VPSLKPRPTPAEPDQHRRRPRLKVPEMPRQSVTSVTSAVRSEHQPRQSGPDGPPIPGVIVFGVIPLRLSRQTIDVL